MPRRPAGMTAHHNRKLLFLIIGLSILLIGAVVLGTLGDREQEAKEEKQQASSSFLLDRREYNGKTYVERTGITSLLLMGIDRTDLSPVQTGYRSGGQADFLLLAVIDSSEKKVSLLHINRDTMVDIVTLGILGKKVGTRNSQICLSHAYGANQMENGKNTMEAVSNLLEGIELNQFYSMNMNAMPTLNDLLGGVTVVMPGDYPELDPSYVKGASITMNGQQAYDFVHGRMNVGNKTNTDRMIRQRAYMDGAQSILIKKLMSGDTEFINRLYDELGDSLTTNVTRGQMVNEAVRAAKYAVQPVAQLEGEFTMGMDGHVEFHADRNWIVNWVLSTYFREDK